LAQGFVFLPVKVDLPDSRVVPRAQDCRAFDAGRILKPVLTRIRCPFPTVNSPLFRIAISTADEIVESVGFATALSDTDYIEIVLTVKDWVA